MQEGSIRGREVWNLVRAARKASGWILAGGEHANEVGRSHVLAERCLEQIQRMNSPESYPWPGRIHAGVPTCDILRQVSAPRVCFAHVPAQPVQFSSCPGTNRCAW